MRAVYDPHYIEFIARLRTARKAKNYAQAELAELLNKPQSFVSKVETCERRIDAIEAARWCAVLGVSLEEILPADLKATLQAKAIYEGQEMNGSSKRLSRNKLAVLREALRPLIGTQFKSLALPKIAMEAFEPSQIGTIVGTLMDALIPHLSDIPQVGLHKHGGILGDREGYPDYKHDSGLRAELKLLYIDNPDLAMKRPPTKREPSARLTQKVTVKNVIPATDALLLVAYQLKPHTDNALAVTPTIVDLEVLSMIELVEARDKRLLGCGGRWFGNYETPCIMSRKGAKKNDKGLPLNLSSYGRKESEGKDFNEDTNFGKLKRIPHSGLQTFLKKCIAVGVGKAPSPYDEKGGAEKVPEPKPS